MTDRQPGFLIRPHPLRGEGLRGYVLRLASENDLYPDVDLYRHLFGGSGTAAATRTKLVHAAAFIGIPVCLMEQLGCRGLTQDRSRCRLSGKSVALNHLRGSRCAVCPPCVARAGCASASWELTALAACPEHGCWLIDKCPRCKRPLSWNRPDVAICGCGFDLGRASTQSAPPAVCALMTLVEQRLRGSLIFQTGQQFGFPAELAKQPLPTLLGMFQAFKNVNFSRGIDESNDTEHASASLRREVAVVTSVANALERWPLGWFGTLARIGAQTTKEESFEYGPRLVTYREISAPYKSLERAPWSAGSTFPAFLRSGLRAYLRGRAVSIGSYRLFEAAAAPRVVDAYRSRLRHLVILRGRRVDLCRVRVSAAAAEALLDATPNQLDALRLSGVLQDPMCGDISAVELDDVFERLSREVIHRARKAQGPLVPLCSFSRASGSALALHLRDIYAGSTPRVTWAHLTPPGLGNLFIPESAATRYADHAEPAGEQGEATRGSGSDACFL